MKRFLGIEHVPNTTSIPLKATLDALLSRHGLSIAKLCGQGYDGTSNIQVEIDGLKRLILSENKSAHYVHCFSHQLQLTLVAIAKKHSKIGDFFCLVNNVVNVVGSSCKRLDFLQEQQGAEVIEALNLGEIPSGRGLNQETSLSRAFDTYVLDMIEKDGLTHEQKYEACQLSNALYLFAYVFCLHFIRIMLGITNKLSQALQKIEQDIVNAMNLVRVCKHQLQELRADNDKWDSLFNQVTLFSEKHDIDVCNMDEMFLLPGRSCRNAP
ncbi:zinc finger MYM-type protein 1-like [Cynara cardunculus var. scolymus]|uniref:zinc finger MYM-type protein 1-like n=1 Tax=Cynara cardunculus var. scolymus TaxID=59895 RepID=UPI000D62A651|nr:zinc finger MYM-type protein 1-like [Cynara cardunculus var. scolymus]